MSESNIEPVEWVRQDKAQAVAEWLIKEEALNASAWYLQYQRVLGERNTSRAECDRLRAECKKAQAERDELAIELGKLKSPGGLEAWERAQYLAVDPDPTSASRRLLAAETLEADSDVDWNGVVSGYLRREAEIDKAKAAREQERDAEIAAVAQALAEIANEGWEGYGYDGPARAAVDALDAHRNERGQK